MPSVRQYAFAILEGKRVNENLTAWPATAMSFDVFDATRGAAMAARLASNVILTDWGARPLAATSPLFDPLHYNNGAVWPFVTGWVALAQYRYHNAHAGRFALDAIARTGFDEALGRNPEVISGRLYKPLDTAVPHQFFATSMVLTPLVRGLLGIEVDAPAGRVRVAPHLPAEWDTVRVEHLAVGDAHLTMRLVRQGREISLRSRAKESKRGRRSPSSSRRRSPSVRKGYDARGVERRSRRSAIPAPSFRATAQCSATPPNSACRGAGDGRCRLRGARRASAIARRRFACSASAMEGAEYHLSLEGRAGTTYALRVRAPDGAPSRVTVLPSQADDDAAHAWVRRITRLGDADRRVSLTGRRRRRLRRARAGLSTELMRRKRGEMSGGRARGRVPLTRATIAASHSMGVGRSARCTNRMAPRAASRPGFSQCGCSSCARLWGERHIRHTPASASCQGCCRARA